MSAPNRGLLDEVLFAEEPRFNPLDASDLPDEALLDTATTPLIQPAPSAAIRDEASGYTLMSLAPGVYELQTQVDFSHEPTIFPIEDPSSLVQVLLPPLEEREEEPRAEEPLVEEAVAEEFLTEEPLAADWSTEESEAPLAKSSPLTIETNARLLLDAGDTVVLTREHLLVTGAESPFLVDLVLASAPTRGVLLRDGFAMGQGDIFTQEDIDQHRIHYRNEGADGQDGFTFATPDEQIPPTEFTIEIVTKHRAPQVSAAGRLFTILESCRIAELLEGTVVCNNLDTQPGLAIVGTAGRGDWFYSLDDGSWHRLEGVYPARALLLGPTHALRFVPRAGWSGRVKLTYRGWDGSEHEAGQWVNLARCHATGGTTAFSHEVAMATTTIERTARPGLPAVAEPWFVQPTAQELVGAGIAVVRLEGEGTWQYSLDDGQSWHDFGAVYHGRARLLRSGDRVRYLPRKDGTGKVLLSGRAWDGREGSAGSIVNLAPSGSCGEETPFDDLVQTRTWRLGG
jgi:hypothetical protein